MKIIFIQFSRLTFCLLILFSCKKAEPLHPLHPPALSKLEMKGLVLVDTLQFVVNGSVIGEAIDNHFKINNGLYSAGEKIGVRKKADGKSIGEIVIAEGPYNQIKKIFYDGTRLSDNITFTPVSNPDHMGCRFTFGTPFKGFYGGPVDIEFFVCVFNQETFEVTYTPYKVVKNVTRYLSEFVEFQPLEASNETMLINYVFKVYKAGTKELPYSSTENLQISDPENNYSSELPFKKGASILFGISPTMYQDQIPAIGDGYVMEDLSFVFR